METATSRGSRATYTTFAVSSSAGGRSDNGRCDLMNRGEGNAASLPVIGLPIFSISFTAASLSSASRKKSSCHFLLKKVNNLQCNVEFHKIIIKNNTIFKKLRRSIAMTSETIAMTSFHAANYKIYWQIKLNQYYLSII